ncbi:hypothetical protein [Rhodoblastus sp.]|uniref:hypothetical protein n=1 Tax=Rhodoblastus sp. TaxID=1962975 RepID=UPI0025F5098D|nr:hypothetical protein [Rhodoblastus sp.]
MPLTIVDLAARWLHIAGVLVWVGHNWANVVNHPYYRRVLPQDPPDAIRGVFMAASKREHGVFRYASLVVWASGLVMLWMRGELVEAYTLSAPSPWIGLGVWAGTLMLLNLWLVLWPHQKKVLGFVAAPVEERLRCTRVTFLSSRTNSFLSLITLLFMVMGAHGG